MPHNQDCLPNCLINEMGHTQSHHLVQISHTKSRIARLTVLKALINAKRLKHYQERIDSDETENTNMSKNDPQPVTNRGHKANVNLPTVILKHRSDDNSQPVVTKDPQFNMTLKSDDVKITRSKLTSKSVATKNPQSQNDTHYIAQQGLKYSLILTLVLNLKYTILTPH